MAPNYSNSTAKCITGALVHIVLTNYESLVRAFQLSHVRRAMKKENNDADLLRTALFRGNKMQSPNRDTDKINESLSQLPLLLLSEFSV